MTGWKGSQRRAELPPDWHITQPRILRRDHHACQHVRADTGRKCGARARDVDHIVPHHLGGGDEDANLQALCPHHHSKKSGQEGGIASGKARAKKAAGSKPLHPGLLATPARRPAPSNNEPPPF